MAIAWRPAKRSASSGSRRGRWQPYRWKPRSGANAAKSSTATATTDTADVRSGHTGASGYTGRFAPSPSGDLHLGSLYTAAASLLDARACGGRWLVRIEDVDGPRVVAGSAAGILRTLDDFGFEWDGAVQYQSNGTQRYLAALEELRGRGLTFECSCSRAQLADEERYPGHCRRQPVIPDLATATRLRVDDGSIQFTDRVQGSFRQNIAAAVGDIVLRRRDGLFAYVLAVVVDDAAQDVTHVVRGADLLDNTPRQIHLQRLLGLAQPTYAHVPVLTETDGKKLAKSRRGVQPDAAARLPQLIRIFSLLGLSPPPELADATLSEAWVWAVDRWNMGRVPRHLARSLDS